jgi:hypothetical protein
VKTHPLVVEQILSVRDQPPEGLRRVPGQKAIQYYLGRDPMLQIFQLPVPSCKTIYRVRHQPMIALLSVENQSISHWSALPL